HRAWVRLLRRHSQRKQRLRSLLLSTSGARFPTLAAVGSASTPSDIRHNAPKDTPKLSRSTCIPLRIRYCFGSVHRLKLKRGPPAAANHSVLRQRQDSGSLSSYEEIWSAKLVVGAHARASCPDRGHQSRQEELAA